MATKKSSSKSAYSRMERRSTFLVVGNATDDRKSLVVDRYQKLRAFKGYDTLKLPRILNSDKNLSLFNRGCPVRTNFTAMVTISETIILAFGAKYTFIY